MAPRKQTPDVLSEILGGEAAAPPPTPAPAPKPAPKPKAAPKPRAKTSTRRSRAKKPVWEYREVIFRDYGGYRPRYVNGQEQPGWKQAPIIHEYLNQLGKEGWELVGVGSREDRQMPAYFKRAK